MRKMLMAATVAASLLAAERSAAQSMLEYNMAFDEQMFGAIANQQAANYASQQQIWYAYMQQYGPMLQQMYMQAQANGQAVGTFEQFAYFMLMTANGTNIQAARQHQQYMYQGGQVANQTLQNAYAAYNNAWPALSARQGQAAQNWDEGAIRGSTMIQGPNGPIYVPQAPTNTPVQGSDGGIYAQDDNGVLYQQQGAGWYAVPR